MKEFLYHLFIPKTSNNYRSRILHNTSLVIVILAFLIGGVVIHHVKKTIPQVLGDSVTITAEQLLALTNQQRIAEGIEPVTMNQTLAQVAALKAKDMFAKNYWAHNAPDGTTPWYFFKRAGYEYLYAGENLARGFNTADDTVKAWMASSSHRENMLSKNYTDVGFAIEEGSLTGEQTILVVEMFGSKTVPALAKKSTVSEVPDTNIQVEKAPAVKVPPVRTPHSVPQAQPVLSSRTLSWNVSTIVLCTFIGVLLLDMIIVERKKIVRLVGHNVDHLLFLGGILVFVLLFAKGAIL